MQRTKKVPSAGVVSRTRTQSKSREWGVGQELKFDFSHFQGDE